MDPISGRRARVERAGYFVCEAGARGRLMLAKGVGKKPVAFFGTEPVKRAHADRFALNNNVQRRVVPKNGLNPVE